MKIEEDVPVTTTANAGAGLDDPKLPIKPKNLFRRFKEISTKTIKKVNENIV